MASVTSTELSKSLGVSAGRISQYVSEGKLDGCYSGSGRQRRFDLEKSFSALGRRLDKGQMLGNGAKTKAAISGAELRPSTEGQGATKLSDNDGDGYTLARTQKTQEEARRLRRQNAESEGTYVLASEVTLQTQKLIAQEIAEFESVLRDGARKIADDLGVDFKSARAILIDQWRSHRARRAEALTKRAASGSMTDAEKAADI